MENNFSEKDEANTAESEKKTETVVYPQGLEKWLLVITAISCAVLELIDTTIVNVALREISGNIGATTTEIAWVITSYGIANVIIIPLSSMLSNLFGRKIYFSSSVIIFTFASLMCGLSDSLWVLVFWRFIQGIGGGGLLSTAQSIILGAFPPKEAATGQAIFGLGVILGPTFGPVLGGFITDNFSWHWIFFVNVPIGVIAALLAMRYVTNLPGVEKLKKIDWWGIVFLVVGIGSLQFILEEGSSKDWFESSEIVFFFITAVLGIIAFIVRELSIDYPAVNLRLYKSFNLAMGNVLNFVIGMVINGSVFIFPLFTQVALGWTATKQGAFMIPGAIATSIGMIIVSRFLNKGSNPKTIMLIGLLMNSTFLFMLSFSGPESNESHFFWPFIIRGFGTALMMMPILGLAVAGLQGKDLAQATGLSNMLRQMGGAVGIAIINIYLNRSTADIHGNMIGNVSDYSEAANERLASFTQMFSQAGYSSDQASQAAYSMLDGIVTKQQMLVSYNQGFGMLGGAVLFCIPFILLIRYNKKEKMRVVNDH
ncbi:DHA2 family efflux MFS transporter permease subunit [Flavobacterium gelatinilyticum]|uniref:DHA2 family efflux MFS transporter permease subunit n=1 Tax=Flavobacterium gelatinilyticum TaxID=3003260 RepID=UPI0024809840|nr:DHA2 family efflux MFS transporter permease subunit [Flavobacterium gelatinilyticum]